MEKTNITLKDSRQVHLRSVTPPDKEGILKLYNSMSNEALRYSMTPYTPERIQRWFNNLQNMIYIVAIGDSRIIGQASINLARHPRRKNVGELGIYLHQDYHNVGLGSVMMETLLKIAKIRGVHKINLEVVSENKNAIHLYEKYGFIVEGTIRDAFYGTDDNYYDCLMMGIKLT